MRAVWFGAVLISWQEIKQAGTGGLALNTSCRIGHASCTAGALRGGTREVKAGIRGRAGKGGHKGKMCHKPKGKRGGAGKMAHTRNWSMKLRGGGRIPR